MTKRPSRVRILMMPYQVTTTKTRWDMPVPPPC